MTKYNIPYNEIFVKWRRGFLPARLISQVDPFAPGRVWVLEFSDGKIEDTRHTAGGREGVRRTTMEKIVRGIMYP